jgi:hypothetical protein
VVDYHRYWSTLYTSVRHHYDQGLSAEEMEPRVAEAVRAYRTGQGFDAALDRHIDWTYRQIHAATQ